MHAQMAFEKLTLAFGECGTEIELGSRIYYLPDDTAQRTNYVYFRVNE